MFQLKCDTQPKDHGCLPCRFGFSVSNGEMHTASGHFTLNNCVVELPTEESTFDVKRGLLCWQLHTLAELDQTSWPKSALQLSFSRKPVSIFRDPDAHVNTVWTWPCEAQQKKAIRMRGMDLRVLPSLAQPGNLPHVRCFRSLWAHATSFWAF